MASSQHLSHYWLEYPLSMEQKEQKQIIGIFYVNVHKWEKAGMPLDAGPQSYYYYWHIVCFFDV